jgi:GT2 family glycosyltransferase
MKIVVLSALGNDVLRRCLDSLLATSPTGEHDVHLVRERGFREQTLNAALAVAGTDDDILFVGDDIEFTPGWYEALEKHYDSGDILGLSMLYPGTGMVQDRGYDLIRLGERITLEAWERGRPVAGTLPFGTRYCDAVCGCFMLVKARVFSRVSRFDEAGRNRWGEFIFASDARHSGARVAVIDHFLYHHGNSTKANRDKVLSSVSYQVERLMWDEVVRRCVRPEDVRLRRREALADEFRELLANGSGRVLFFGIGTVTEFILAQRQLDVGRIGFCSGLPEEAGMEFHGERVLSVEEAPFQEFDWIVVTPLVVGERLCRELILPRLPADFDGRVSTVDVEVLKDAHIYSSRDVVGPVEPVIGCPGEEESPLVAGPI